MWFCLFCFPTMIVAVFNLAKDKKLKKKKSQNLQVYKSYLKCTQSSPAFISQHVKRAAKLERQMKYRTHHELHKVTLWEAALSFPTWVLNKAPPYGDTYQYRSGGGTEPWACIKEGLSSSAVECQVVEMWVWVSSKYSLICPGPHQCLVLLHWIWIWQLCKAAGLAPGWDKAEASKVPRSIPKSNWFPKEIRNTKGLLNSGGKCDLTLSWQLQGPWPKQLAVFLPMAVGTYMLLSCCSDPGLPSKEHWANSTVTKQLSSSLLHPDTSTRPKK